jgi:hypothetical protein
MLRNGLIMLTSFFTISTFAAPTSLDCKASKIGIEEKLSEMIDVSRKIAGVNNTCPNQGDMDLLCMYVGSHTPDNDPESYYSYYYQRIVYEASCVDLETNSDEEISRKVRLMWNKYGRNLKCGPMGVGESAHVLKYAAYRLMDSFIEDAATVWKIDLNHFDTSDSGRTVLDYLEDQINRTGSGETNKKMRQYYKLLRDSGARHRRELK